MPSTMFRGATLSLFAWTLSIVLAAQQQSTGVTHMRDRLLAGGEAANSIGVGSPAGA